MLPYIEQRPRIAALYAKAPSFDPLAVSAWEALADDCTERALALTFKLRISVTDESEPYPDAAAMCADIANGSFVVSRAHSDHPVWTVEQNVNFRIVHDCIGHYVSGGGFDWDGENAACAVHAALLSPLARRALFTECIAQTAFTTLNGYFPDQKVALLDHLL